MTAPPPSSDRPGAQSEDTAIVDTLAWEPAREPTTADVTDMDQDITDNIENGSLNPSATEFLPNNYLDTPASPQGPKFPNNSSRQRGSNVLLTDPEKEFQKTALDVCRSTIIQQETELKRLNESLNIRNKKIMQLENQIEHAANYMADIDSAGSAFTRTNTDKTTNHQHQQLTMLQQHQAHTTRCQL